LTRTSKQLCVEHVTHSQQRTRNQRVFSPGRLANIIQSTKNLITPYTHLHTSCASTKSLQLILASLSSSSFSSTSLMVLLTDARELHKVLAERQMGVHDKLEPAMDRFQAAGISILGPRIPESSDYLLTRHHAMHSSNPPSSNIHIATIDQPYRHRPAWKLPQQSRRHQAPRQSGGYG
jgi:hypothetical protein